jgi:hypothetical protein
MKTSQINDKGFLQIFLRKRLKASYGNLPEKTFRKPGS